MATDRLKLSDQVRRAIDAGGMSRYAICKELQIPQSLMSRFMSGKAGVSLRVLDRIGELLGLSIVSVAPGRGRPTAARQVHHAKSFQAERAGTGPRRRRDSRKERPAVRTLD